MYFYASTYQYLKQLKCAEKIKKIRLETVAGAATPHNRRQIFRKTHNHNVFKSLKSNHFDIRYSIFM